ncbi:MAG: alkaline phosphatase family protein [Verrucomicrobia bacterium]|nr:alkaline phosphatase family protein [Verrucomicrobiota bacterium]
MMRILFLLALLFPGLVRAVPPVEHVIVVSIDGAKPPVVAESAMPVLKQMAAEGAVTWQARTIFPPLTLPSHTSMLTGVGPDKHQILWNGYTPIKGVVKVPTVFSALRREQPEAVTAMFVGKVKFRHLWLPDSLTVFDFGGPQSATAVGAAPDMEKNKIPSQTVAARAAAWIREHKPKLAFVHFTDPDSAGHASGWGSPEQKEALKVTDQALGQILRALRESGMAERSVVLVSADHGGHDKGHGLDIPDDMIIPWMAWGHGVKKGSVIPGPVSTVDTAATVLWLLGVKPGPGMEGKPVTAAFLD